MPDDYPSNSRRKRADEESARSSSISVQSRKVVKVTKGGIVQRKKPFLLRIFGENTKSVGSYILWDVLIPAAKNTITEMISNGIEMLVYGEPRNTSLRRNRDRSYVSYTGYSRDSRDRGRSDRPDHGRTLNRHKFDDIILESRADAEEVLSNLVDLIDDYGVATVADFYDLIGSSGEWSDNKYGWDNLSRAEVRRVRDGYILDMPRPVALD